MSHGVFSTFTRRLPPMMRSLHTRVLLPIGALALLAVLAACGGSSPQSITVPPPNGYTITAAALNPSSINAGASATSAITVTPANGYTGTVTLSCKVTGSSTGAPTCAFGTNPVAITAHHRRQFHTHRLRAGERAEHHFHFGRERNRREQRRSDQRIAIPCTPLPPEKFSTSSSSSRRTALPTICFTIRI